MIHEIRLENYYGIKDEVVLDLRIPRNAPDLPGYRPSRSRSDQRLPTVVALFGPNAAGKSTLLRALTATVAFACKSFDLDVHAPIPGFQVFMSGEHGEKPTRVSFMFDARWLAKSPDEAPQLFRYELELVASDAFSPSRDKVSYEALFHFPKGKPRRLFERRAGSPVYMSSEFGIKPNDSRLEAIRDNSSVVSTLAKFNHVLATLMYADLISLQTNLWGMTRASWTADQVVRYYSENPQTIERLNRELARFDIGISAMELKEVKNKVFPWFRHEGLAAPILLEEESSGTRHFVTIFPILKFVLETGHVGVFDEFDADLHPDLVRELLGWFHSPERNPLGAQIFVTLHNAALLDFLEKEEVFFVQKGPAGGTEVYSARDIKGLRRGPSLYKKYLGGELGALPRIG